jgi:hypothetical protein
VGRDLDYKTAEEFIDALSPTGSVLGSRSMEGLLFRGHADADWLLLPAVLRSGVAATNAEQVRVEAVALREFLRSADRQGLPIPSDGDALRRALDDAADDDRFLDFIRPGRDGLVTEPVWPQRHVRPLMALAQHHGLPTRMLDWTGRPLVAAYFAAIASAISALSKPLAVVVLDLAKSHAARRFHHEGSIDVVAVPYASNENALAQSGVFTVETRVLLVAHGSVDVIPIETWSAALPGEQNPLFKLVLPASESGRLLRLLARHGITAATMFPGYDGVVRALDERTFWK